MIFKDDRIDFKINHHKKVAIQAKAREMGMSMGSFLEFCVDKVLK